jgi:N-glycosidase YbiA
LAFYDFFREISGFNMTIYFYSTREKPYGCFSNFSAHGFELENYWWHTSEHYFQAQKFVNTDFYWFQKIQAIKAPKEAAKMGRNRQHPLRTDWEEIKDEIMYRAVLCKFKTHLDIRQILLDTNEQLIIEDSPMDYYWGCGQDGSGKNQLGEILMQVRAEIKQQNLKQQNF